MAGFTVETRKATEAQQFFACFSRMIRAFFLLGIVFACSCPATLRQAAAEESTSPKSQETVRLQLKWRHQFQFAGYYAAIEQGYFQEAGLKVELIQGDPKLDLSQILLTNQAEYAVMPPSVLIERQQGKPFVVLGAIFQHSATIIMTRKDAGLLTPQDLRGKRVMMTPLFDAEDHAMLINEGVPLAAVEIIPHSWSLDDLINRKVDAQSAYLTNEPYLMQQKGVEPAIIRPVTYGVDFYGDLLVTTEHEIKNHSERTAAFYQAVQRGWLYALDHPEEIARLIIDRYSQEKSLEHLLFEAKAMQELVRPELVEIGYMNQERWRRMADVYVQLGLMQPGYSLKGFLYAELQQEMIAAQQRVVTQSLHVLGVALVAGLVVGFVLLLFNNRLNYQVRKRTAELAAREQHFRSFFDLASVGVAQVEARSGRFFKVNKKYCAIVGYTEEELLEKTFREVTHPDDALIDQQQRVDLIAGRITEFTTEKRYVRKDGSVVWVILSVTPMWRPGETPDYSLAVVRDITVRKLAEEKLVFASKVFEHSIEGIVVTDVKGNILQVNQAFSKITGYSAEEAIGQNPKILKSNKHEPDFYQQMWSQLSTVGQWSGEIWNRRKSGEVYPEWLTINAVHDSQGRITNYVSIFHDITELKRQQEALEHQAQHDALTGLPNRILFNDRLQMALNRMERKGTQVALMFLDLDNFKHINDGFGHTAGDQLLIELANRLKVLLRLGDTLARQGGDEFLILLPDIDSIDTVILVASRLLNTMRQPFYHKDIEYFVTGSIGITIAPVDGLYPDILIKNADMAMYRAKKLGRNNFQFFTAELDGQAHRRISLEAKLRKAIEMEEFELFYQPQVGSRGGLIFGAEALIRWRHGDELISPMEFIPLAEESGLILPLGEWVMRTAARQVKQWHEAGHRLNVSINISARQFAGQDLARLFRNTVQATGLAAGMLYFEITESMLMGDVEKARRILTDLRDEGGKFYLDDFGTGYSSLSYLKRLPLDGLKIDRSFIRDIATDMDSRAIASAIVSLAKTLNMAIVAEGVETLEHLHILDAMSAMLIQGYLASPPVPAADFTSLLQQGKGLLPEERAQD